MAVNPQDCRAFISLLCWQFVGALVGVGVNLLLWLQSASPKREQLTDLVIIALANAIVVFWALRREPPVRTRVLIFSLIGAVSAWLLAPASSAGFDQRLARIFSDPFFAFRPLYFACSAVVVGLVGFFLPTLRRCLLTLNNAPGEQSRAKSETKKVQDREGTETV